MPNGMFRILPCNRMIRENVLREWQELSREESLVKKLRRRKITRQQYERLLNNQEDEESIDSDGSEPSQGTANDQEDTSDWEAVIYRLL